MRNLRLLLVPTAMLLGGFADQSVDADWMDPNYAFCEDVGVHASGRVRATAKLAVENNVRRIKSLSLTTTHAHSHKASGSVQWTAPDGSRKSQNLQVPWFEILSAPGAGQTLVLPRNGAGRGPGAQVPLDTQLGTSITINLSLAFVTPGGTCPTSFSQSWALPS
jgi:hypothetical protein